MKFIKTNKKNKGFSLVEILVVLLILGVLFVVMIPRISESMNKARELQVKTDFRNFSTATEAVLREYSGFAGVPIVDEGGRTVLKNGKPVTIASFWSNGLNIEETEEFPITSSLIKAVNHYLDFSYEFNADPNDVSFGRSATLDPWKQPYEIYFVARNSLAGQVQSAASDRIYITSNGKTNHTDFPDYTLLTQYKAGEVRLLSVGFDGEIYPANCDYVVGQANGRNYIALNDLFEYETNAKDTFFAIKDYAQYNKDTIFKLGMGIKNKYRLCYTITDSTENNTMNTNIESERASVLIEAK